MPITFEIEYLRNLQEDCRSCVYLEHGKEHLALHPFQLDNISNSIKELLNKNIARYCTHLNGILLGYDNIKLLSSDGLICDDSCFVHTDIEADFYVFKPEIDSTLQGVVSKISKDHVACLVHKTFTITLPKPEDALSWIGNKAQIGQEVQFTIVEAVFNGSLPYIRGNIISLDNIDDSGFSTNEDHQGSDECQLEEPKERTVTRRRKLTKSLEDQGVEEVEPPKQKKRKTKKKVSLQVYQDVEIVSPKQKKRKKDKHESLEKNHFIDESTSKNDKKDKRLKGKLFEDDLLKVDFSVIHTDDYDDSKLTADSNKKEKKNRKRKRNAPFEDDLIKVDSSVIHNDLKEKENRKRKRNASFEDDLIKVDSSVIHNDDYEDSKLIADSPKEEKKNRKRKRHEGKFENLSKEIPLRKEKSKKRKRNSLAEEQTVIINTSTNTDFELHNTDKTFDSSLSKKHKKSKRRNSLDAKEVSIKEHDSSENRKKKDISKQENEHDASDDATKILDCTNKYEDLLKRLSLQIGDNSLIGELSDLLSEKLYKSKKGKKRKK